MNREEAAAKLGISVRSLQRIVKAGRLTVTYKRGESGKQEASFDPDEIARYKQAMEAETVKPAIAAPEATTSDTALARIDAPQFFNALQRFVADGAKSTNHSYPQVAIENKPLLKLDEASTLTGLSRQILREAISTEKLKAKGRVSQFMLPSIRVVDIEFDNCRVHLCRLGKTDCPTMQSLQMCSEAEVVPLNILRSRFADVVTLWIKCLAIGSRHRYFCF